MILKSNPPPAEAQPQVVVVAQPPQPQDVSVRSHIRAQKRRASRLRKLRHLVGGSELPQDEINRLATEAEDVTALIERSRAAERKFDAQT